ncbi:hypothetical protein L226DRAFT_436672, partial [Lentinus tigrinus ALCF2SS1-7]|uniref:uncharacterized protein n=1 Tax=Lentinus tigrinus ALCF2SS1-7 TaxID=1328758 RepID=UPI001165FA84
PDPFDGTPKNYRTWKSQMTRYLASSPETPENQRITILLGNMSGTGVDSWVNAFTDRHLDTTTSLWTVTLAQVWQELDMTYADRLAERTALRNLETLLQTNCKDAAEYFQKFEGYVREANLTTDDLLVLEWAKRGTHTRIKESIYRTADIPETYDAWK